LGLIRRLKGAIMQGCKTGAFRQIAGFSGFTEDDFQGDVEFRIHRIVAAHYDYSYRRPVRAVRVRLIDLVDLLRSPEFDDVAGWVERVYSRRDVIEATSTDQGVQLKLDFRT
jgi:hypothetical protein